ncbi:hypothetical protein IT087_02645 [Candidatus Uhrbacteria bacterium]|nr:hypothetical protein [Candidatus Uhrbacteria bacterium]
MKGHALDYPAMAPDQGRLIAIDAIDGAGKDTIAKELCSALEHRGRKVCNLDTIIKEAKSPYFPLGDSEFFEKYDAIYVSEPTHGGIGLTIREEIMKKESTYNALATAWAYAIDRHVLYERTVLPFLRAKPNRLVLQGRGLMSSLTYQTIQSEEEGKPLSVSDLLALPGNRLELSRPPDLIILLVCSVEVAQRRLAGRTDAPVTDKFSDPRFQAKVSLRYRSPEVIGTFERLGSRVVYIDAERTVPEVSADCLRALNALIPA